MKVRKTQIPVSLFSSYFAFCFLLFSVSCINHVHDAVKLNSCEEYPTCDTTKDNSQDSGGPVPALPNCGPVLFDFAEPCFSDQSGDTLRLSFTLPIISAVHLEILDDNEKKVDMLFNGDTLPPAYHSIMWPIDFGYDILGVRFQASKYSKTFWFYTR